MKKTETLPPEQRYRSRGGKFFPALCNILGTLMLVAVILASLSMTLPRFMGYEIYEVISGSMTPAIPVGSVIYVDPVAPESIEVEDVIAFNSGGTVVCHRVVENRRVVGEMVTKGDANAGEDLSAVSYRDVIGVVIKHYPLVGRLMRIYTSNVGKIYVLAFAACGLMFNILAGRLRDRQRARLTKKLELDLKGTDMEGLIQAVKYPLWKRRLRTAFMTLLMCIFLFCAATVFTVMRQYQTGDALYGDAADRFMGYKVGEGDVITMDGVSPIYDPTGANKPVVPQNTVRLADPAPIDVDFAELARETDDCIGWLYCPDTVINYPVMQGENDDYYLHRSYDGAYSVFGSIFAESKNRPDFMDPNTIVYGHHMRNGSMFATLDRWASQYYYENHPVMWLLTPTQDYEVVLVAGYTTSATSDTYQLYPENNELFHAYLDSALAKSDFETEAKVDYNARYVVLSTCAYVFDNARYVLFGMLVPAASAGGVPFTN